MEGKRFDSPVRHLSFEGISDLHFEAALERLTKDINDHQLANLVFGDYGKGLIKKFGVSPDAFVQMAIQLAYYKMYGTCRPTYESSQTRKYAFGRTETTRSVSNESVAWVKIMNSDAAVFYF